MFQEDSDSDEESVNIWKTANRNRDFSIADLSKTQSIRSSNLDAPTIYVAHDHDEESKDAKEEKDDRRFSTLLELNYSNVTTQHRQTQ